VLLLPVQHAVANLSDRGDRSVTRHRFLQSVLPPGNLHAALSMDCHGYCNRLRRSREVKAAAAVPPLPAVSAQQSHRLSQTEAVGPPAITPPLTPLQMCPLALTSFCGSAACLLPHAMLLHIRWVLSNWWAPIPHCEPSRCVCLPLPCEQSVERRWTEQRA